MRELVEEKNYTFIDRTCWLNPRDDTSNSFGTLFRDILTHYPDFMKWTVDRRGTCIQAGGNIGIYPYALSTIFERVYTFEPDPLNFYCLVNNVMKPNVNCMQAALSDTNSVAKCTRHFPGNPGSVVTYVASPPAPGFSTPVMRLDDFTFFGCDFIQLDVEGMEFKVLRGAENLISRYKPVISVERTSQDIDIFLGDRGYKKRATILEDTIYSV